MKKYITEKVDARGGFTIEFLGVFRPAVARLHRTAGFDLFGVALNQTEQVVVVAVILAGLRDHLRQRQSSAKSMTMPLTGWAA